MVRTSFVQETKTHILCPITLSENRAVEEIIRKNKLEPDRPQLEIRGMHI